MADHGTRTRFNQGCTEGADGSACDPCKKANRDYFKKYGQDKKAEKLGTVTNFPSAKDSKSPTPAAPEIGPCEAAVIKTLESVPAAANRPDLVQSARAMARLQDNPLYAAQQTAASKQLQALMAELMKGTERKGRLAAVRQMSQPKSAAG